MHEKVKRIEAKLRQKGSSVAGLSHQGAMSADNNSGSGNSWTLLTPEQTGVQNVVPVADGTKTEGDSVCSSASKPSTEVHTDLLTNSTEASSAEQCESAHRHESQDTKEIHSPEPPQVKPSETSESRAQLNAAQDNEDATSASATIEDLRSLPSDHEEQDALTGHSKSPDCPSTDVDSFSDSFTHISPTSGSSTHPASVHQEREGFTSEESHDSKPDVDLSETKEKGGDGLRKRNITHVGSLDHTKTEADDDEDGEEEEFQLPERQEEKLFSLNKCILAAVILLGLGTIFFSGVLMEADDEGEIDVGELKDPVNKEWLNPEVSSEVPVVPGPPDILNKLAKEDEQILVLNAQLQQHQSELKAQEGEEEHVRREELEKDYQRIKEELDRLPALQKELEQENERMKEESERAKKELEAVPLLHRELEQLRAKVSQLTHSTEKAEHVHPLTASGMPSSGDIRNVPPIEPQHAKHKKYWGKKSSENEPSREDKEWKKKKKDGKERRESVTEEDVKEQKDWKKDKSKPEERKAGKNKEWRDEKEWKRDKKQEYGEIGGENEEKKAFKDRDAKKGRKEEKKTKKDKHEGQDEGRRDKKGGKDGGKKKVKEDKENEWKQKVEKKDQKDEKESGWKEKKREWKEKDERKGEKEFKKGKSEGKINDKTEKKWKGGEKEFAGKEVKENHWRGKERQWSTDGEWKRDELKDEKKNKAYRKNEEKKVHNEKEKRYKDEKEWSNDARHKHGPSDHTSFHHHNVQRQSSGGDHDNYWPRQRQKIQHNRPSETCSSVAECARVEGLYPVSLQDFDILLQSYLKKIQFPQDQTLEKEELSKLVKEFFTDGVFAHDQMPFSEFVEDVADILEDMADGEMSDEEESEEDDDDDEEMEEFEREAMEMFALSEDAGRKASRKVRG